MRSRVLSVLGVMSGQPVIVGTRILAETILSYLRDGVNEEAIHNDYPSLPEDGVEAVRRWALETYGPGWKTKT